LLAQRLDALPNGYPATEDGAELRLLEKLFKPEEAELASKLRMTLESPQQIADRLGLDAKETRLALKGMAKRGLIKAGKMEGGLGFGLLPFAVGIYEFQIGRMDQEMAELFEEYYQQAFAQVLAVNPQVHRVIPVNETIRTGMEIAPYESVTSIVDEAKSWGVVDCICRQQKAFIGDPCDHPLDVCMTLSTVPGAFDHNRTIKALTRDEAMDTLSRAADAGLVHSVGNNQEGLWYICNCCSCSCGILRAMSEMGVANVVAHSSFINVVDEVLCNGCETCLDYCQFDALELDGLMMTVNELSCVGCGVCVPHCDTEALHLVAREEKVVPPKTEMDWMALRAEARGKDMSEVL
ncbi:MAG: 4Fe-4S ferredoxin, partial [Gammaproteobacteria bacterium]|nr:4Fe-4S ferredoxin [Gammaproteobacteria bacterium]